MPESFDTNRFAMDKGWTRRGPTTYHIQGCTPSLFGVRTLVGIAQSSLGIGIAVEGLNVMSLTE
jgi:hypothetical protein